MDPQNKFLLPDKSFWIALDSEQREVLSSKYTIFCPFILFTEVARHGLNARNTLLNLENIVFLLHWSERAKMDLLMAESSKPLPFGCSDAMKSVRESSEYELLAFKEISRENIEMLKESEEFYRNLDAIVNPLKEELLSLFENMDDLSEGWMDKLKEVMRAHQVYGPEIERTIKRIETVGFSREHKERLRAAIEKVCDAYTADSLENANQLAASLFNHDPSDYSAAYDKLQRLCTVFDPILTQEERTRVFNRFLEEGMPPVSRFAPYALGAMVWIITIQLFLRENPENAAPKNVFRDAAYLLYTSHKDLTFASGDKWHRRFIKEVPLFEGVRENFIFVDLTTKGTIQEDFSKLL